MEVGDPFFLVKSEVEKTIETLQGQYKQWQLQAIHKTITDETTFLSNEIKNNLKNIEWDLEDLEETIKSVEKNPLRFNLDQFEISKRQTFVNQTRQMIKSIEKEIEHFNTAYNKSYSKTKNNLFSMPTSKIKYSKLESNEDRDESDDNSRLLDNASQKQKLIIKSQDDQLDTIGSSVRNLKNMSQMIGTELDDQSVMLDEFAKEMEETDSRMNYTLKKISKVLHISSDKRQWIAIGILLLILFIIILLFIIL